MTKDTRIDAFSKLGLCIQIYIDSKYSDSNFSQNLTNVVRKAKIQNAWFTPEQIHNSLTAWAHALQKQQLNTWLKAYPLKHSSPKTIAVVMAGNIPLVGFHDFLCVLMSGHRFVGKLSSNDQLLLPFLAEELINIQPGFQSKI